MALDTKDIVKVVIGIAMAGIVAGGTAGGITHSREIGGIVGGCASVFIGLCACCTRKLIDNYYSSLPSPSISDAELARPTIL